MELSLVEMGKTERETGVCVYVHVCFAAAVNGSQELSFRHVKLEMPSRYPNGGARQTSGYMGLEFRGEAYFGDVSLEVWMAF